MFSSIQELPDQVRQRLQDSWADTFYHEIFLRIPEEVFAVLYSTEDSRPNTPVNVLVGLEILKAGFGWSDEEMMNHYYYDVQVRYALGYRDLSAGYLTLRTVYNFRQRLVEHMQETGENLIEVAFEHLTDEQIAAFEVRTDKIRMDSTLIASNIRETTRLQLLVEVLQRVHRMLDEATQHRYAAEFEPFLKGSSGQYIYHLKREAYPEHLQRIGILMQRLVTELEAAYGPHPVYQVLQRVFKEHFVVADNGLRPKEGTELSASSLQSPDDQEATYREKRGVGYVGYTGNGAETCHPKNDVQLIVKVQVEPNTTDDAVMLDDALPELQERMEVKEMYTDGGYNSPQVDETMRDQGVKHIQSAIRGRQPAADKLGWEDFTWETTTAGEPETVTCPGGQTVDVTPGRKVDRYRAAFDADQCASCPLREQCRTQPLKQTPERVAYVSQSQVDLALRRQRSAQARASGQNLRAAVEATMRSLKYPFRNGKVPVRGLARVSMVVIASAAMTNARRIHRYQVAKRENEGVEKTETRIQNRTENERGESVDSLLLSFLTRWRSFARSLNLFRPALAYGT
jgi:hypothetical protein